MPYDTCEAFYDNYDVYYSEKICNGLFNIYCCGKCNKRYCCSSSILQLDQSKCIVPNSSWVIWILATIVPFFIVIFMCIIIRCVKSSSSSERSTNQQSLELNPTYSPQIANDSTQRSSRVNTFDNKVYPTDHDLPPSYETIIESAKNSSQQTSV